MQRFGVSTSARRPRRCLLAAIEALEIRRFMCVFHQDDSGIVEPKPLGPHYDLVNPDEKEIAKLAKAVKSSSLKLSFAPRPMDGPKQQPAAASSLAAAATPAPSGGLNGKVAYVSMGHGWTWTGSAWATQRPETNDMVEDFGTQDQGTFYANYLLNAGATVVPMRPLGHQTNEVIVDNNEAQFTTLSGSWSTSSGASPGTWYSKNSGADAANRFRFATAAATETAVARFTPNLPSAGFYPVYAWALNGSNRVPDQTFRINHSGGSAEVKVNLELTGRGWIYLGTYYFESGSAGNVEVSNKSSQVGDVVVADAVRFGNGMGDFNPGSGISGKPREDEAALYWLYRSRGYTDRLEDGTIVPVQITPASEVDGGTADDNSANVSAPPRWSAYMNQGTLGAYTDRIFLSFHSNAFDGTARGTLALFNTPAPTTNQAAWMNAVSDEVEQDLLAMTAPPLENTWMDRAETLAGTYGEISNNTINGEFNATLLEVAFHDNLTDARLLRDPKVRNAVARASYQATAKHLLGAGTTLMPDPPTNVRALTQSDGSITVSWTAPGTGPANGGAGAASGYKIYTSTNGYGWDNVYAVGAVTNRNITAAELAAAGNPTYFKVAATNAGGESINFGADVVAAKSQLGGKAKILIVNGFDRMQRSTDDTIAYGTSPNTVDRVRYRYNNTRDYPIQYGEAIEAFNGSLGFDTVQNEAVIAGTVNLTNYHTVLWISGEESSTDTTFDATERTKVTQFINGGGKFLSSGAEVGFELDSVGLDPAFYNNSLHADYVDDDATVYTATGDSGSIFNGITGITFDNGVNEGMTNRTYDVDFPDIIAPFPASGTLAATSAMTYAAPGGTAAIQWASGSSKVVTMGFPFETITTASKRNQVMSGILTYFDVNSTLISATPGVPDLTPATDSGTNTDNRTNFNNSSVATAPQFITPGTVVGATVTLYRGTDVIGSTVASFTTTTLTASGAFTLSEGNQNITARQTEPSKPQSPDSPALTLIIDTIAPAAPTALSNTTTTTQVFLNWDDNIETDLAGYDVYRASVTGGPYTKVNISTLPASSFTNALLTPGTNYFYVVRASDTAGNASGDSNESAATTVPFNPTGLSATPGGGYEINLSWSLPSGNRDGFAIERRTGADPFAEIATVGAAMSTYADSTGLAPGTSYEYRIRAYTGTTYSSYNGPTSAATFIPGDANGSGAVDIDDLFAIDYGFANHLIGWINGDFNNDGAVDSLDYTIIYNAF